MRTIVFTSDNHSWLLRGFFHQWKKYGGGRGVEVAGFTKPDFLPGNVPFHSMGDFKDYPVQKWSDAIINALRRIPDERFILLLEDYWLIREVNWAAIDAADEMMRRFWRIMRFDIAADRMFARGAEFVDSMENVDFCSCKGDYSLSFQASIYDRKMLLDVMRYNETPWQAEIDGSTRLNALNDYYVYGTYQWPMNYVIVMNKGKLDLDGQWMYPARGISAVEQMELAAAGCLEPEVA